MENLSLKKEALVKENEALRVQLNQAQQFIKSIQDKYLVNTGKLQFIEELEKDAKDTGNTDVVS